VSSIRKHRADSYITHHNFALCSLLIYNLLLIFIIFYCIPLHVEIKHVKLLLCDYMQEQLFFAISNLKYSQNSK